MRTALATLLALACSACATDPSVAPRATESPRPIPYQGPMDDGTAGLIMTTKIPTSAPQASLVFGWVDSGTTVVYEGQPVRLSGKGEFVIGIPREKTGVATLYLTARNGEKVTHNITITPRTFPLERVNHVPDSTVNPPPDIAARIEREQAEVNAARQRDDDRDDFTVKFIWPVKGRISGWFGSQRIYNGTPASPHSGVDVAAPQGTPIHAPAGGIVTFANPDLYLTGGTVVVDHGHGVSSNILHMSRIDVKVGDRVEQGQVIGLVGKTGRANGPHMHWGMNWFNVRIDPQSLMPPGDAK